MHRRGCQLGQVERHSVCRQAKVTPGVMRGIGHQPEMRQLRAGLKICIRLGRKDKVRCIDIASRHPKGIRKPRQGAGDAACRF